MVQETPAELNSCEQGHHACGVAFPQLRSGNRRCLTGFRVNSPLETAYSNQIARDQQLYILTEGCSVNYFIRKWLQEHTCLHFRLELNRVLGEKESLLWHGGIRTSNVSNVTVESSNHSAIHDKTHAWCGNPLQANLE